MNFKIPKGFEAGNWLANLEEYPCNTCGNNSIFKNKCPNCDTFETNKYRLNELKQEIEWLNKDVDEAISERDNKINEIQELAEYFNNKREET